MVNSANTLFGYFHCKYVLTTTTDVRRNPYSVADCAEAGTRDRGCKQRIPGRGWIEETDVENRFGSTERIAGAVWREITTVAAMGREEKGRRRALRIKVCLAYTLDTVARLT